MLREISKYILTEKINNCNIFFKKILKNRHFFKLFLFKSRNHKVFDKKIQILSIFSDILRYPRARVRCLLNVVFFFNEKHFCK